MTDNYKKRMYPLFEKFHNAFESGNENEIKKALYEILEEQQKIDSHNKFAINYNGKVLHFSALDFNKFKIKFEISDKCSATAEYDSSKKQMRILRNAIRTLTEQEIIGDLLHEEDHALKHYLTYFQHNFSPNSLEYKYLDTVKFAQAQNEAHTNFCGLCPQKGLFPRTPVPIHTLFKLQEIPINIDKTLTIEEQKQLNNVTNTDKATDGRHIVVSNAFYHLSTIEKDAYAIQDYYENNYIDFLNERYGTDLPHVNRGMQELKQGIKSFNIRYNTYDLSDEEILKLFDKCVIALHNNSVSPNQLNALEASIIYDMTTISLYTYGQINLHKYLELSDENKKNQILEDNGYEVLKPKKENEYHILLSSITDTDLFKQLTQEQMESDPKAVISALLINGKEIKNYIQNFRFIVDFLENEKHKFSNEEIEHIIHILCPEYETIKKEIEVENKNKNGLGISKLIMYRENEPIVKQESSGEELIMKRMNINNVAKSDSITYDCGLLTKEALDKVVDILQQTNIIDKLKDMGVQVPKIVPQPNMHCTFRYLSGVQDAEKRGNQLSNQELHYKGTLCVESVGVYVKDGILMNLGLLVNEEKSMNEEEFSKIRDGLFGKDISHVTVAINRDKGNDGRRLARAVDTEKCFTPFDGTPTSGEFSYVIKLDEPVILPVTAEAVIHLKQEKEIM